jgi:para-nitrobenzyl esterase
VRFLDKLGIAPPDAGRLPDVPIAAILAASQEVFDEVPVRNPGTLAFVPIVDGDLLHDYPVKLAREGRSHPVPLIIGTNKREAALFRLMRSPLMPITPRAITSMFTQIAAEQPDLQLPTEEQIGSAYSRLRRKARSLNIATDAGFRMPSVWLAEGHSRVAPVYLYRFDYSTPFLKLLLISAAHATELPYVWGNLGAPKDPTLKLGGAKTAKAVSKRVRARWINFAAREARGPGRRAGLDALPGGRPRLPDHRQARHRRARRRLPHPGRLGQRDRQLPVVALRPDQPLLSGGAGAACGGRAVRRARRVQRLCTPQDRRQRW